MDKSKPKIVFSSTLNYFEKKRLPILILEAKVSIFATKEVNIAMIGANAYCMACKLKKTQIFAASIRDLENQAEKEARPETDPKSVV